MAKPPIQVKINTKAIAKALRAVDAKLPRELRQANKEVAAEALKYVLPEVPVLTGRLQKSTRVKANTYSAGIKSGTPARAPYAGPRHFGWPLKGWKANYYIYRGINNAGPKLIKVYEKRISRLLKSNGIRIKIGT